MIYINVISNPSDKFDYIIFADDTNLFMTPRTLDRLQTKVITELEKISRRVLAND